MNDNDELECIDITTILILLEWEIIGFKMWHKETCRDGFKQ